MPVEIREHFGRNRYPGRVVGFRSSRPGHLEALTMLTGRSAASKARVLEPIRHGNIVLRTRAPFDTRAGDVRDWIMLSTYRSDGMAIEPNYEFTRVVFDTADPLTEMWEAADPNYRVAAASVTFDNGTATTRVVSPEGAIPTSERE
ncbi:hypothetical protein OHB26_37180 [Nocardia sp. NBC_01503]|uniref:hypothetical protein n=1 Tax=Nocardia sp. NBC_01503 TaxID=2975997 RepID=UPI002E7C549A|nr:hypothetical protein [Nocardia sp. NBC_01503]WTL32433.1 hypothetical protein OHB26_37180 [Nocardia sp. NBC_01503]